MTDDVRIGSWVDNINGPGRLLAEQINAAADDDLTSVMQAASEHQLAWANTWAHLKGDMFVASMVAFEEGRRVGRSER